MPELRYRVLQTRGSKVAPCRHRRPGSFLRSVSHGVSLIEVMIAMLVLLIGLLGMLKLQSDSLKATYASFQRAVVTVRLQDVAERLWAGVCVLNQSNATAVVDEAKAAASASGTANIARWDVPSGPNYGTGNVVTFNYRWFDRVENGYTAYQAFSFMHPDC